MNIPYFSELSKLADMILYNGRLLYVIPNLGVDIGFGDNTVEQVCNERGVSAPLFLVVCNTYTFDDYSPSGDLLSRINPSDIIGYLRSTHQDYIEKRLPDITGRLMEMVDHCLVENGDMLIKFCDSYRNEVLEHLDYEEKFVFPYLIQYWGETENGKFDMHSYHDNHSDIEAALNDLKSIIIKYLPTECTIEKCREILDRLFMFEYDMRKHAGFEELIINHIGDER